MSNVRCEDCDEVIWRGPLGREVMALDAMRRHAERCHPGEPIEVEATLDAPVSN